MEKLIHAVTTKLCESDFRFLEVRAKQIGMESSSEYLRNLVESDKKSATDNLTLLADALGVNVYQENGENK